MNVDRAYSGKAGNKVDLELAKALGIIGRRPGLADRIHCISGCGAKAWWKERKAPEKTGDPKAHCSSAGVRLVDADVGRTRAVFQRGGRGRPHLERKLELELIEH